MRRQAQAGRWVRRQAQAGRAGGRTLGTLADAWAPARRQLARAARACGLWAHADARGRR